MWLVDKLTDLNLDSISQDTIGNVIAKLNSNIPNIDNTIMFIAHLDSVSPCEGIIPTVEEVEDDFVISAETDTILSADDKAGVAAMIETIKYIRQNDLKHPNIELVFTVREEIGLEGAKELDFSRFKARLAYAIDGEAPVGTIITSGPTHKNILITIKGKSAHAGLAPEKGLNAIKIAAELISVLPIGRVNKETTFNIGVITGGIANNITPEKTVLSGEIRSLTLEKLETFTQELSAAIEAIKAHYPQAKIDYEEDIIYQGFSICPESAVVKLAKQSCSELHIRSKLSSIGAGSDANIFNRNGIETVILGAGFKNSHSRDEMISFSQLVQLQKLMVKIVQESGKQSINFESLIY